MAVGLPLPSSPCRPPWAPDAWQRGGRVVTPPSVVSSTALRVLVGFAALCRPWMALSTDVVFRASRGHRRARVAAPLQQSSPSAFPVVESTHAFTAAVPPALLLVPTLLIVKPHHAPWPPFVSQWWDFPFLTAATLHSPTSSPPVGDAAPPPSPYPIGQPSPPSAHFSCCCRRPSPVGAAACPGFQASPPSRHCRRC